MDHIVRWITALNSLASRIAASLRWVAPLLARATVGLVFVLSGWGKLNDLATVTQFFSELGIPAPAFHAVLASTTEFVCGALLLLGLATRFAVVPLVVTMIVAIRTALWDQVDGIASLVGLLEFSYIALLVFIGTHGPGPVSADASLARWLAVARNDPPSPMVTHTQIA